MDAAGCAPQLEAKREKEAAHAEAYRDRTERHLDNLSTIQHKAAAEAAARAPLYERRRRERARAAAKASDRQFVSIFAGQHTVSAES